MSCWTFARSDLDRSLSYFALFPYRFPSLSLCLCLSQSLACSLTFLTLPPFHPLSQSSPLLPPSLSTTLLFLTLRVCVCVCRQQDLFRVLKAYTLYRPEEGYCQAQAPIAAVLLMNMPAEVSSWMTVQTPRLSLLGPVSVICVNTPPIWAPGLFLG